MSNSVSDSQAKHAVISVITILASDIVRTGVILDTLLTGC